MKSITITRAKARTFKEVLSPLLCELPPGLAIPLRNDCEIVRDGVVKHFTTAMGAAVVVHTRFEHQGPGTLFSTPTADDLQAPKRWLRRLAPRLTAAGAIMSAGRVTLRARRTGIFSAAGFDIDYDLLTACPAHALSAVRHVLRTQSHGRAVWPHCKPSLLTLRSAVAMRAEVRQIWPASAAVELGEGFWNDMSQRDCATMHDRVQQAASTALRAAGARGLSSFSGLARNGDAIVRLKVGRPRLRPQSKDSPARMRRQRAEDWPEPEAPRGDRLGWPPRSSSY